MDSAGMGIPKGAALPAERDAPSGPQQTPIKE